MKPVLAFLLLPAALVVAGCGLGAGEAPGGSSLVVTQRFGAQPMIQTDTPKVSGSDTVMRLLQRNAKVKTRFGGGFVQSIDGVSGGTPGGRPTDWFFYVNGVESSKGAVSVKLTGGNAVWWDRHDWGTVTRTAAVVGSFPEPFLHGPEGKRFPVRVECSQAQSKACSEVEKRLTKAGVIAARGGVAQSFTEHTLRILVGPYLEIRDDHAVRQLEAGPTSSGVFARPSADGRTMQLLDERARIVQSLGAGSGLIAATRYQDDQPVWVVTGTDEAGVDAAVQAFDEGDLLNHFAVAVVAGRAVPLPAERGPR